jgi:hypothetical protein
VEAGQPHQPEEAEAGPCRWVAEAEALQDHAGLLAAGAMQAKEEEAVFRPLCPALGQELEEPLQKSDRSR